MNFSEKCPLILRHFVTLDFQFDSNKICTSLQRNCFLDLFFLFLSFFSSLNEQRIKNDSIPNQELLPCLLQQIIHLNERAYSDRNLQSVRQKKNFLRNVINNNKVRTYDSSFRYFIRLYRRYRGSHHSHVHIINAVLPRDVIENIISHSRRRSHISNTRKDTKSRSFVLLFFTFLRRVFSPYFFSLSLRFRARSLNFYLSLFSLIAIFR